MHMSIVTPDTHTRTNTHAHTHTHTHTHTHITGNMQQIPTISHHGGDKQIVNRHNLACFFFIIILPDRPLNLPSTAVTMQM